MPSLKAHLEARLLRIRLVEEAIAQRYREQKMRCPVHLSIGQEAVAVGVCSQLRATDYALSGHRAHAHYLAKGGDLKRMIAELYGKKTGCARGRGGSMHLVDLSVGFLGSTPLVGGTLPIGVGVAFAIRLKAEQRRVAVFFGEGATEEGVFAESLNFAALHQLPLLFVCENNLYSVYSPLHVRWPKGRSLIRLAEAHGLLAFHGNGNCLTSVFETTQKALEAIDAGRGPVFLEYETYRLKEHCGPQIDPYQPEAERSAWQRRDPLLSIVEDASISEAIYAEIEEAFAYAEASPWPDPEGEETVYD